MAPTVFHKGPPREWNALPNANRSDGWAQLKECQSVASHAMTDDAASAIARAAAAKDQEAAALARWFVYLHHMLCALDLSVLVQPSCVPRATNQTHAMCSLICVGRSSSLPDGTRRVLHHRAGITWFGDRLELSLKIDHQSSMRVHGFSRA
jgi:hypothetical protein